MTTTCQLERRCAICGKVSEHSVVASTTTFGQQDLDTRPPELERSTISMWIQRCPSCGYCAPDISKGNQELSKIVQSDSYQKQLENPDYPKLANSFLSWSVIQESVGQFANSGWASIQAAWVCDDARSDVGSQNCRERAIMLFQKAKKEGQKWYVESSTEDRILIDLLRRSGQFEIALGICEEGLKKGCYLFDLILLLYYEKGLIEMKDSSCHNIEDVFRWFKQTKDSYPIEIATKALENSDDSTREKAVSFLGKIGDKRAVEPLIEALKDENNNVRRAALQALGKMRDARAVKAIVQAMQDRKMYVTYEALQALGEIGDEHAIETLTQILRDKNRSFRERVTAAEALGNTENVRAVEALIQAMKEEDGDIQRMVIKSLGRIGAPSVEPLIKTLKHEKDVRDEAVEAFDGIKNKNAVESLIKALTDEDSSVRICAVRALGRIGDSRAVEALIQAINDESSDVQWNAIWSLGEIKDVQAIDTLIRVLKDKNEDLRGAAAGALGKIKDRQARKVPSFLEKTGARVVEALTQALKDEDRSVRWRAANSLGKIKSPMAVEALTKAMKNDNDRDVQKAAKEALRKSGMN